MTRYGIYYRDREFAHEMGDPLLAEVSATCPEDAIHAAEQLGIDSRGAGLWAWPLIALMGTRTDADAPGSLT